MPILIPHRQEVDEVFNLCHQFGRKASNLLDQGFFGHAVLGLHFSPSVHAARSPSIWRSQETIWFQLAGIGDAKYLYNFWRPVTAIHDADADGNPDTSAAPTWTPLQPTYPMPNHDSAHSVEGGAADEVLKQFFESDDTHFTACSLTLPAGSTCSDASPVRRSYRSFSQAADENAASRILMGIHFRRAVEEGVRHGRRIGRRAVNHVLQPVHGHEDERERDKD
jgi:hypothetical protein